MLDKIIFIRYGKNIVSLEKNLFIIIQNFYTSKCILKFFFTIILRLFVTLRIIQELLKFLYKICENKI